MATLWESNRPFGFPLVLFPLGSTYFVFVVFPFDVSDGRCGVIVSVPDHCLPSILLFRYLVFGTLYPCCHIYKTQTLQRYLTKLDAYRQIMYL